MADKKQQLRVRETNENLFDFLKAQLPALFGTKVFADVEYMGQDETDQSFFTIRFVEEDA